MQRSSRQSEALRCIGRGVCVLAVLAMQTGGRAQGQTSRTGEPTATSWLIEQLDDGQPQTIVAYGTSLTAAGAWVHQLSSKLNARYPGQITWVNAALSGTASASGLAELDRRVLSKQPDAVFIEFAMNDAFTEYPAGNIDEDITVEMARSNLLEMIARIKQQNAAVQIVLQTMNPSWDAPNGNQSGTKRPDLHEYYQMYRQVAAERNLLLIDNFPVWKKLQANQPAEFLQRVSDGTHPDATGYARLVTPAVLDGLGGENGLVLLVDVQSGRTVLHNQSDDSLEIISYTINSPAAALKTSWSSMADQQLDGWHEANPAASHLSELNPTGSGSLAADERFDLGAAWSPSGALDLAFNYQTLDGVQHSGLVVYTTGVDELLTIAGDYNSDGVVDLADYTVWRNTLGATVTVGTGADGDASGVIDAGDYAAWKANFAASYSDAAAIGDGSYQSLPEPNAVALALGALMFATAWPLWQQRW